MIFSSVHNVRPLPYELLLILAVPWKESNQTAFKPVYLRKPGRKTTQGRTQGFPQSTTGEWSQWWALWTVLLGCHFSETVPIFWCVTLNSYDCFLKDRADDTAQLLHTEWERSLYKEHMTEKKKKLKLARKKEGYYRKRENIDISHVQNTLSVGSEGCQSYFYEKRELQEMRTFKYNWVKCSRQKVLMEES